jgi:hypothetical protein
VDIDIEKIKKARIVLDKMANGVNPVDGSRIGEESFLNDPRIIRCLFFVNDILNMAINGELEDRNTDRKKLPFVITEEERAQVIFPEYDIGVNAFSQCINKVINPHESKKLSGMELNKQLKKMGILGEQENGQGKKKTIVPEESIKYGIHTVLVNYNGAEYEKVVFDSSGVSFLLENLEKIMSV